MTSLRCQCGTVRGFVAEVTPQSVNRVVCYCDDCQAFIHFLERTELLDAHGGSDICQVAPGRMKLTQGSEALRCVRLSRKGLYRFYAGCCRTPAGNTIKGFPFVGINAAFMDHAADGQTRDEALGPLASHIFGRFAIGGTPAHAPDRASFRDIARPAGLIAGWWLRGLGKPSPFFDPQTGAPRAALQVLTQEERDALRKRVGSG